MDFTFSPDQIAKISARLGRDIEGWLKDCTVEPHYSAERLAELLEVSERTIWTHVEKYESSNGKEGLGPFVKLSHKCVRIPASSVNRMLKAHTIDAAKLTNPEEAAAA